MIQLTLYHNLSEPNKIGKNIEVVETFQGTLKDETSIINPVIEIRTNNFPLANYAYIPVFGRYYFVTDIASVKNGLWSITMKSDPLESFKDQIKENVGIIERQEKTFNLYLKDDKLNLINETFTTTKKIGNTSFDNKTYVLCTR